LVFLADGSVAVVAQQVLIIHVAALGGVVGVSEAIGRKGICPGYWTSRYQWAYRPETGVL